MPEPLQIQLRLTEQTTVGHLRTFLELAAEAPNAAPLDLIYDEQTYGIQAIAADVVR